MMRWNSTKTYTEDDMRRMQQEAVSRVHEYQTRARQTMPFYDVPESAITPYHDAIEPMLFSPEVAYPGFSGYLGEPEPPPNQSEFSRSTEETAENDTNASAESPTGTAALQPTPAPATPADITDPIRGLLEKFDVDPETFLILGLIFLLHNEKADNILLIALGYLLL